VTGFADDGGPTCWHAVTCNGCAGAGHQYGLTCDDCKGKGSTLVERPWCGQEHDDGEARGH
jgi:DnaJ-class molecular chaperone